MYGTVISTPIRNPLSHEKTASVHENVVVLTSTEYRTFVIGIGFRVIRDIAVGTGNEHVLNNLQEEKRTT